MIRKRNLVLMMAVAVAVAAPAALATNGMNMQGYGPIAYGMGGASMAYDNGMAAVVNNPATLAMMPQGNRLDVALGFLGPDGKAEAGGQSVKSDATAFWMPAVGFGKKVGALTYGFGMFAQGGMGTEYAGDSFMAAGSGEMVRSELGVGRLIFPIAYEVDSNLKIGGTVDYVWAGLDIKMALSGAQFLDMSAFPGATQTAGTVSGSMMNTFGCIVMGGPGCPPSPPYPPAGTLNPANPVNWGRFDFSNTNDFTGQAKGDGFAGKIGMVYKVDKKLAIGATYHSKVSLGDLKADSATVSFNANVDTGVAGGGAPSGVYVPATITLSGKVDVKDFSWPAQMGLGMAFQASDQLLIVADYKRIMWKDAMKDFKLTFTADAQTGMAAVFSGAELDATLYQNWKDQDVYQIGFGYKTSEVLVLRAGFNYGKSPIPADYVNPLFPAIMEKHLTLGAGYAIDKTQTFDAGFAYAPQIKATNAGGAESSMGGKSFQLMYSNRF